MFLKLHSTNCTRPAQHQTAVINVCFLCLRIISSLPSCPSLLLTHQPNPHYVHYPTLCLLRPHFHPHSVNIKLHEFWRRLPELLFVILCLFHSFLFSFSRFLVVSYIIWLSRTMWLCMFFCFSCYWSTFIVPDPRHTLQGSADEPQTVQCCHYGERKIIGV